MSHGQKGATQDIFNQRIRQKDEGALPHGAELAERGTCSRRGRKNAPGRGGGQLLGNPGDGRKNGKAKAWAEEGSKVQQSEDSQESEEAADESGGRIDTLTLPYVMLSELAYLPECPGVYFVIEKG